MVKVVLTQRDDSGYDDLDGVVYHFPERYLGRMRSALGDFALFYQPRRGQRGQCYWAVARIDDIQPDPVLGKHYYARLSEHAEFPAPVTPWRVDGRTWESSIQKDERTLNRGQMGWSVRAIPDSEFTDIVAAGLNEELGSTIAAAPLGLHLTDDGQMPFEVERVTRKIILDKVARAAAFSKVVRSAYDSTCAFTGIRVIDGENLAEMEAAHIRPVTDNGPDIAKNGLALCRTAHWLFDHGLLAVSDDFRLLRSPQLSHDLPSQLRLTQDKITLPSQGHLWPHPAFLRHHRETYFIK
tara:strand:+ start:1522 stop:2409 length:888 start_codon:yes stop_codon:yes gene_type:complete